MDDLADALDHNNLMRNRNFQKGFSDLEYIEDKKVNPQKLLPYISFKGKKFGWLRDISYEKWAEEFKKIYNRDISYILAMSEKDGINLPIVIGGDLADGFGRVLLAYGVGEKLPVALFSGVD